MLLHVGCKVQFYLHGVDNFLNWLSAVLAILKGQLVCVRV